MSENEKKDIERDPTEASEDVEAEATGDEATDSGAEAAKADEAEATDDAEAGDGAGEADPAEDAQAADAAGDADETEATDQTEAPSEEELSAAEREVEEDSNIEAGPNDPSDPSEFRNLVANAAGITGPDQPREMFASEDPELTDDELRARGMEPDAFPAAPLVVMILATTVFLGVAALGLLQLYRYVTDDMLSERNWSVVDPALAAQRENNREILTSAGTAWGEAQEGEVRIPVGVAQSLLIGSPEWLERHPLAPVPAEPVEVPVESPAEQLDETQEELDSADDDPTDEDGEAVDEQADQPSPAGDDKGAEAPGEDDEE